MDRLPDQTIAAFRDAQIDLTRSDAFTTEAKQEIYQHCETCIKTLKENKPRKFFKVLGELHMDHCDLMDEILDVVFQSLNIKTIDDLKKNLV